GRERPPGHLDAGSRACGTLRSRHRWATDRELPASPDTRGADAGARVREVARPQPRAGGPRGTDGRGGGDGPRAAGRHGLDSRPRRALMSFLLPCPVCGPRDVNEFAYAGEVTERPRTSPSQRELSSYVYFRRNVAGVQRE